MNVILSKFYITNQLHKEMPTTYHKDWLSLVAHAAVEKKSFPGYRSGVRLVPVDNLHGLILHKTVTLEIGEVLTTEYLPRVEGEEPRKHTFGTMKRAALPEAEHIFAVLYHRDVLAEDGEVIDGDWAVVAHTTSSVPEPEPIGVGTLIANHFHLSGGTETNMSPEEFEAALKKSVLYWKDKIVAEVED